jgi:hypothetical protein
MRSCRPKTDSKTLVRFRRQPRIPGEEQGAAHEEDFKVLDDENTDRKYATPSEVQAAIEQLGLSPAHKVHRAARVLMSGSEYQNPSELLGEAVKRCMQAANGQQGRPWPLDVPFEAYLIQSMEGLASDSRDSWYQRNHVAIEALALEGQSADDVLGELDRHVLSVEDALIGAEERSQREDEAEANIARIKAHFANKPAVTNLIEGKLADLSATETREMFDMTQTEYDSAHRAYRRGLERLFADGGKT